MNYKQLLTIFALMGVPFFLPQPEASGAKATKSETAANASPFTRGPETFELKDTKGKTPQFRVLDDSPAEKALAVAIATSINAQEEVDPKIPVKDYLDLKLEKITLTPVEGSPELLSLALTISGHEVPFEKTISRNELASGKEVSLKFPAHDRAVSLFSVQSNGHLRFRFDSKKDQLVINDALARMQFEAPMIGEGSEAIRFSGVGLRAKL